VRDHALAGAAGPIETGRKFLARFGVVAALLACLVAFLGIGPSAASAAPEAGPAWNYQFTFGVEGNIVNGGADPARNEIALDSSGRIFAQQTNNGFVAVYEPSPTAGTELLTGAAGGPLTVNIAIDQSNDALYVERAQAYSEPPVLQRWLSDGQPTPTYTLDPSFEIPQGDGFAVDPTNQDILVTDPGAESVRRYDTTGTLVETIATPSTSPSWILMMADGTFYVGSASGPDLIHFSGSGTLLDTIAGVGQLSGLAYDPVREVIVASVGSQLKNYSPAGALEGLSPSHGNGISAVVDPTGRLYEETATGGVSVYLPGVQPGVEDPVVSEITGHSAHIEAEVEPGEEGPGEAPPGSRAHLEYSTDGGAHWKSLPDKELTEPGVAIVEADLTELLANFEYQVRVVAENASGNKATSDAVPFSTSEIAPEVETGAAGGLGETGATLNGTVNPNGFQTTYHFEYGTTTGYGSRVPVAIDAVAGNQRTSRSFSQAVAGLAPGTTYHYRIVAESSLGESFGSDRTFTTAAAGEVPPRAYELVTPVDKRGAQVSNDFKFQAAEDGSAIAVNVSAGPSDGESAMIRQSYVLWRGADGWSDWVNADAPIAAQGGLFEATTFAISKDFTQALVVSNRDLAPGGIAGGGNLYIKDLDSGTYTFVAGAPGSEAFPQLAGVSVTNSVFAAAAPDFSWILFWSGIPLVPGAEDNQFYRWSREDGLALESRLPDGSIPFGFFFAVTPNVSTKLELPPASADGSLVAFDLHKYGIGGVYVRENEQSTAISVSHRAGDDPSEVLPGILDWVTPSGRYVFFHSEASLTEDTPSASGKANVYRYDTETGALIYIALTVPGGSNFAVYGVAEDGETAYVYGPGGTVVWHEGALDTVTTDVLASSGQANYPTDNGRFFAWIGGDREAHLYDAESGDSVCVSCSADGSSVGLAHIVPASRAMANRSPRAVLEDGTMFFDTANPLLPSDHNSTQDVYSYRDGHLTLISPGNGNYIATFVEASEDGRDVFFQTNQGILPQDVDESFDVYDARVGGGFPQAPSKSICSGEGCRGPIGGSPQGPVIGSSDSGETTGPAIGSLKALTPSDRAKLARGKTAPLKLKVGRPGKVKVVGTATVGRVINASIQAEQAGALSLPIKLSKKGLKELNRKGSLAIRLMVSLGGEGQKVASFTLKSAGPGKGGHS
jgi:hypothetical protein